MINNFARIIKTNEVKKINEIEVILGETIFYMSDKTSYSSSQIKVINCEIDDNILNLESLAFAILKHNQELKNKNINNYLDSLNLK